MKNQSVSRRSFLTKSAVTLGGAMGALVAGGAVVKAAEQCFQTPAQPEGPFYPIADQEDKNNNLVKVKGRSRSAEGQVIWVYGQVQDENCKPVKGALVEIWQACHTGKYNHPGDPNTAKLDPNFQYWGMDSTDSRGRYWFKTIIPGAYPATSSWVRPPHIHYKVSKRGYRELVTQLYFKGNEHNKDDRILRSLTKAEQKQVVVQLKPIEGKLAGKFDLTINSI